jgi:hypothetical protein
MMGNGLSAINGFAPKPLDETKSYWVEADHCSGVQPRMQNDGAGNFVSRCNENAGPARDLLLRYFV